MSLLDFAFCVSHVSSFTFASRDPASKISFICFVATIHKAITYKIRKIWRESATNETNSNRSWIKFPLDLQSDPWTGQNHGQVSSWRSETSVLNMALKISFTKLRPSYIHVPLIASMYRYRNVDKPSINQCVRSLFFGRFFERSETRLKILATSMHYQPISRTSPNLHVRRLAIARTRVSPC